jgi:GH25 family lysozyme M1 (1,4-beta-N-acetylmuramidase)
MFKGVDVSRHQGIIDWDNFLEDEHSDFAIIRAGFGKNNIDAQAVRNVSECERLGIPYGLYWFSYALTPEMARREAEYLSEFVGNHKPSYPLVYDFEYDSVTHAVKNGVKISRDFVLNCTEQFCHRLEELGFYAMFYCNNDYYQRYYQASKVAEKYDMWYARYATSPGRPVTLWQTSESGMVKGIQGKVDLDQTERDYPKIIIRNDLNNWKDALHG